MRFYLSAAFVLLYLMSLDCCVLSQIASACLQRQPTPYPLHIVFEIFVICL